MTKVIIKHRAKEIYELVYNIVMLYDYDICYLLLACVNIQA